VVWKIVFGVVAVLVIVLAAAVVYGSLSWRRSTQAIHATLEGARRRRAEAGQRYDPAELETLPPVVRRYFERALTPGQPIVTAVDIEHTGTFNTREDGEQWRPFSSTQRVVTDRPGFCWDARVAMLPGLPVHVHDAYIAGNGILHVSLLGLITVADMRDTPEMARGELMRYFAEGAWYPTALLPSQGVRWEAIDDRSARATMEDGPVQLSMIFRFGDDALIDTVYAAARERVVGGQTENRPWEGHFFDYREVDGMIVPMQGEVSWILGEERKPYWRGTIRRIAYETAQ
jgi:hypothetical protein